MPSSTSRLGLPYPLGTDTPNFNNDIENLANALDVIGLKMESGTLALRPAAGHAGFVYLATDQTGEDGNLGQWFYDTGTVWILINPPNPLATSVTTSAVGDAALVGTSLLLARQDHKHARESFAGSGGTYGSSADPARYDHTHAPVAMRAYLNSSWTLTASTPQIVQYNAVDFDTNGGFNTASYIYTVPVAGYYRVGASLAFPSGSVTTTALAVFHNGTQHSVGPGLVDVGANFGGSDSLIGTAQALVNCAASDTLYIAVQTTASGQTPDIDETRCWFTVSKT